MVDIICDAKYTKFDKNEIIKYKILDDFYKKIDGTTILEMIDIINGKSLVSLRLLDWFVTQYCKMYKICYPLKSENEYDDMVGYDEEFYVYLSYKAQLKTYNKKRFDPFRRNKKFYYSFNVNGTTIKLDTTLGQLQFFKWAFESDIINYVKQNLDKISKSMLSFNKIDKCKLKNKKNNVSESSSLDSDDTEVIFD